MTASAGLTVWREQIVRRPRIRGVQRFPEQLVHVREERLALALRIGEDDEIIDQTHDRDRRELFGQTRDAVEIGSRRTLPAFFEVAPVLRIEPL